MRTPSVVLLSGGLDSSANLALAHLKDQVVLALFARYGQRAARAEERAASTIAAHYGVRFECVDLPWLGALGGSALTDRSQEIPELSRERLDDLSVTQISAKKVWVPNRNAVLIAVASAYAERLEAQHVVVGFNREEAATFPDNSTAFLEASNRALMFSSKGVSVHSYTHALDKREIVTRLKQLQYPFPFSRIWSCYWDGEKICGRCESCGRFLRATDEGLR
jgi:7-cyano-7-deazaguanine synthase